MESNAHASQRHSLARRLPAGRLAWMVLLACGFSIVASSCGQVEALREREAERADGGQASVGGGSAAGDQAGPTTDDCQETARLFAEALVGGEYGAAYELTSARLRKRMSREDFAAACSNAAQEFGQAQRLGPVVAELTDGLGGAAASDQYGFPKDIPDRDRLAWVHASLALELDGDEILRYYDCWMLLENDGGEARVGHFKFALGN